MVPGFVLKEILAILNENGGTPEHKAISAQALATKYNERTSRSLSSDLWNESWGTDWWYLIRSVHGIESMQLGNKADASTVHFFLPEPKLYTPEQTKLFNMVHKFSSRLHRATVADLETIYRPKKYGSLALHISRIFGGISVDDFLIKVMRAKIVNTEARTYSLTPTKIQTRKKMGQSPAADQQGTFGRKDSYRVPDDVEREIVAILKLAGATKAKPMNAGMLASSYNQRTHTSLKDAMKCESESSPWYILLQQMERSVGSTVIGDSVNNVLLYLKYNEEQTDFVESVARLLSSFKEDFAFEDVDKRFSLLYDTTFGSLSDHIVQLFGPMTGNEFLQQVLRANSTGFVAVDDNEGTELGKRPRLDSVQEPAGKRICLYKPDYCAKRNENIEDDKEDDEGEVNVIMEVDNRGLSQSPLLPSTSKQVFFTPMTVGSVASPALDAASSPIENQQLSHIDFSGPYPMIPEFVSKEILAILNEHGGTPEHKAISAQTLAVKYNDRTGRSLEYDLRGESGREDWWSLIRSVHGIESMQLRSKADVSTVYFYLPQSKPYTPGQMNLMILVRKFSLQLPRATVADLETIYRPINYDSLAQCVAECFDGISVDDFLMKVMRAELVDERTRTYCLISAQNLIIKRKGKSVVSDAQSKSLYRVPDDVEREIVSILKQTGATKDKPINAVTLGNLYCQRTRTSLKFAMKCESELTPWYMLLLRLEGNLIASKQIGDKVRAENVLLYQKYDEEQLVFMDIVLRLLDSFKEDFTFEDVNKRYSLLYDTADGMLSDKISRLFGAEMTWDEFLQQVLRVKSDDAELGKRPRLFTPNQLAGKRVCLDIIDGKDGDDNNKEGDDEVHTMEVYYQDHPHSPSFFLASK